MAGRLDEQECRREFMRLWLRTRRLTHAQAASLFYISENLIKSKVTGRRIVTDRIIGQIERVEHVLILGGWIHRWPEGNVPNRLICFLAPIEAFDGVDLIDSRRQPEREMRDNFREWAKENHRRVLLSVPSTRGNPKPDIIEINPVSRNALHP